MIRPTKLGVAGGIIWGLCMFFTTIVSIYTGYANPFLEMMASIYPGYTISWWGSLAGLIYGFFDAFIGLALLGWVYNLMTVKNKK